MPLSPIYIYAEPVLAIDAFHSELVMQSIDAGLRKEVPQRQTEDSGEKRWGDRGPI